MSLDLEKIKKIGFEKDVVLKIRFAASTDDGYGSWDIPGQETVVGKNIDDPGLEQNISRVVEQTLGRNDVKKGSQKPHFSLEERRIRRIPFQVGGLKIDIG